MIAAFALSILIASFIALLNIGVPVGKRALSACTKLALAFLKSAHVLFGEFLAAACLIFSIRFVSSNHFILDYYIICLFSSLILVRYHLLNTSNYSTVNR